MKITKRQLRRIIKEEKARLLEGQLMYHSTDPKNIGSIQQDGLIVGRESSHTLGGSWADQYYGTRPVYLSVEKSKYEGTPLAVDTSGLDLVADLPSLIDTGAYQEEEGMYWDEGSEPAQMIDIVDEDGMVYFDDLLSPGSAAAEAAIEITGTAAALENIPPNRIQLAERRHVKITKSQLIKIIREAYGDIPEDLNFQVAMKIKDMMPPDEALSMHDEDFRALVVSVFDDHFDETGEGWDPYDDDLKEIEDHLTVVPEPGDPDYDSYAYEKGMHEGKKMKLSKAQIQNIIRESMKTIKMGSGDWDREDFLQAISDYSKEQDGVRMDLDRAGLSDAPIEKLAQYYKDMFPQGSTEIPAGFDFSDLPTDDEAHPMEKRASRSGMKRRVEGRKRIAEAAPMGGAPDTVGLFQKGRPDPILDALIDDYEDFIEYQGLPTRQSDKAAAEFFKQDPDRRDDHDAHQMLADALGLSHDNIMKHMSEGKKMKITKRQLRKIIKEEKQKLLSEAAYRHPKTGEDLLLMLNDVVDKLMDAGMDYYELAGELRGLADDVENSDPGMAR